MKFAPRSVSILTAGIILTSQTNLLAGDWDDVKPGNYGEAQVWVNFDGIGSWREGECVNLDEFERAGSDDEAIAQNASDIAQNAADIDEVQEAVSETTTATEQNTSDIAENKSDISKNAKDIATNSERITENANSITELDEKISHLDEELKRGVAMVAALDFERPLPGKTYRLALGGGSYESESAVALGLTAVKGSMDFGVGVAMSGSDTLAKGSVGFSF